MRGRIMAGAAVASAVALVAAIPASSVAAHTTHTRTSPPTPTGSQSKHVLLISVDGLHQSDLTWYVRQHPTSELARLEAGGREYANARTPVPSDSFPGMVAQVTGGDPRVTGVYYDAEYSRAVLAPGTTHCAGTPLGGQVHFEESIDDNPLSIDAGQGLSGLPGSILRMTGQPQNLIDTTKLPVDPATCTPIYPHQYLQVNTIFEVARAHGLRTAWSDKHPAYDILNGPSGTGIQDLFTPEINSNAIGFPAGDDWTSDNAATMQYDSYKVQAVINEIDGYDHSRSTKVGVPAIFGMNFQTVSTAEKLLSSDGLTGGYLPGTRTPGPLLARALGYINAKLTLMASELQNQGLANSTAIILSAKHGQSPQNPSELTRIDDGPIVDAINAVWAKTHPGNTQLIADGTDDDAVMMWLSDHSAAAAQFVRNYLLSHPATGTTINGGSRTLQSSGLKQVYAGAAAAKYFGVPVSDPRHPDIWGIVQHGVVYTGGSKIAEHGGANIEDRHVPIVVYAPSAVSPSVVQGLVHTTQIAPTILSLLGLHPAELQAVREEGTKVLPGVSISAAPARQGR